MKVQKGITLNYETIQKVKQYLEDKDIDFSNFIEKLLIEKIEEDK